MRKHRTLLLLLLIAAAFLFWPDEDQPLGGEFRKTPEAAAAALPDTAPLPPNPPATAQAPLPVTRFLARLRWGDELRRFRALGDLLTAGQLRDELNRGAHWILNCDGELPGNAWEDLEFLSTPARDMAALRLVNGAKARRPEELAVRVWTLGAAYPESRIARAEWFLAHLEQFARANVAGGVDVVVTPELGREIFPHRKSWPERAAGVYFPGDQFCAVRSQLPAGLAEHVLCHELSHAFLGRYTEHFSAYRFVEEGLAEYLPSLEPGDEGLRIPTERFADEMALLDQVLTMLARMGIRLEQLNMRRLVTLPPHLFYSFPIGYPLAQAAMIYVGPAVIEQSIRDRNASALVEALSSISWSKFREFVHEQGLHGVPLRAHWIEEGSAEAEGEPHVSLDLVLGVLGIKREEESKNFEEIAWAEVSGSKRRGEVLAMMQGDDAVVVAADLSEAMDRLLASPVRLGDLFQYPDLEVEAITPRAVVNEILALYVEPKFIGLSQEWEPPIDHRVRLPFDAGSLTRWVAKTGEERAPLIICCATRSGQWEEHAARWIWTYRQWLDHAGLRPAAVLVLDFVEGGGDGLLIAKAFASRHFGAGVAYWQPATPLPR